MLLWANYGPSFRPKLRRGGGERSCADAQRERANDDCRFRNVILCCRTRAFHHDEMSGWRQRRSLVRTINCLGYDESVRRELGRVRFIRILHKHGCGLRKKLSSIILGESARANAFFGSAVLRGMLLQARVWTKRANHRRIADPHRGRANGILQATHCKEWGGVGAAYFVAIVRNACAKEWLPGSDEWRS